MEVRRPYTDYTREQFNMISRMLANGMKAKVIARIFDTTPGAISDFRLYESQIAQRLAAQEGRDG